MMNGKFKKNDRNLNFIKNNLFVYKIIFESSQKNFTYIYVKNKVMFFYDLKVNLFLESMKIIFIFALLKKLILFKQLKIKNKIILCLQNIQAVSFFSHRLSSSVASGDQFLGIRRAKSIN